MKNQNHQLGVAALALVVCLAVTPALHARPDRDRGFDFPDRIVKIVKKILRIGVFDYPTPPKP